MFRLTVLIKLFQQRLFTARFIHAFRNAWQSNEEFMSMLPNSLKWLDPGSLPLIEKFVIKMTINGSSLYLTDYNNVCQVGEMAATANRVGERKVSWGKREDALEFICLEEAFLVLDIVKGSRNLDINVFQGGVKIER